MVSSTSPLQQGFYGNIEACLPIGVHFNSAFFASEQGIVSTVMSLPNSTAVGTELACMPRINDVQRNILVKAPLFKVLLEGKERNTHNLTIESFPFGAESFKVLNRNICIISQSHLSNLSDNFAYSVLHKVMLISFESSKRLLSIVASHVGIMLQNRLSLKDFLPLNPNIISKIILMQNLSFRRDNRNSKAFAVYIHSKDIPSGRQFNILLGKVSDDLQIRSQAIGLACPSILEKVGISLEVAVLNNGNRDGILRKDAEPDKRHTEVKGFGVARNIEFQGSILSFALASPSRTFNIADNLRIKRGAFLGI